MDQEPPIPKSVEKQPKTVEQTAKSFWKAGMASALSSFDFGNRLTAFNARRAMAEVNQQSLPSQGKEPDISSIPEFENDMRVDSDDIHYHFAPTTTTTSKPAGGQSGLAGTAVKMGLAALMAGTGLGAAVGLPLAISSIPEIIKSISPPAATSPATEPGDGGTDLPVLDLQRVWGLKVGKPE